MTDWHRIFTVSLADLLTGTPFEVDGERELSRVKQRLDAVVMRLPSAPAEPREWPDMPDGLTDLADNSLLSFKSLGDTLSAGTIAELISCVVLFAKQEWGDDWEPALFDTLRLRSIAVATHRPQWLSTTPRTEIAAGVYELAWIGPPLRIIVPRETELVERNTYWHLLSGQPELVHLGLANYQVHNARFKCTTPGSRKPLGAAGRQRTTGRWTVKNSSGAFQGVGRQAEFLVRFASW